MESSKNSNLDLEELEKELEINEQDINNAFNPPKDEEDPLKELLQSTPKDIDEDDELISIPKQAIEQKEDELLSDYKKVDKEKEDLKNLDAQEFLSSLKEETKKEEDKLPELSDILLPNDIQSEQDRKRSYLLASAAFLLLFILTIVVIRLLTPKEENKKDDLVKNVTVEDKEILDNSEIEKQYQNIVTKKLKIKSIEEDSNDDILNQLDEEPNLELEKKLNKKRQQPKKIEKKQEYKKIQYKQKNSIKQKKSIEQKKVIKETKKEIKKLKKSIHSIYYEPIKEPTKEIKKETKNKTSMVFPKNESSYLNKFKNVSYSIPKTRYYIQVAAFSTKPPQDLINKIIKNGFRMKIYHTTIKGRPISKLLVGPYKSRNDAKLKRDLKVVKKKIVKGAFIFKISK